MLYFSVNFHFYLFLFIFETIYHAIDYISLNSQDSCLCSFSEIIVMNSTLCEHKSFVYFSLIE